MRKHPGVMLLQKAPANYLFCQLRTKTSCPDFVHEFSRSPSAPKVSPGSLLMFVTELCELYAERVCNG